MKADSHLFVCGQAGSGKTTRLIEGAVAETGQCMVDSSETLLALTFMHGARRRLSARLLDACKDKNAQSVTIDSFALSLVNKWRRSLGIGRPVLAAKTRPAVGADVYSFLSFEDVLTQAVALLESPTVGKWVSESYPLIVVDEFQDCYGARLEFIKALSRWSCLLLAADEFQLLDDSVDGCPAVEWALSSCSDGRCRLVELEAIQRTTNKAGAPHSGSLYETPTSVPIGS